ncbi:uncharacterized protein C1orf226 homolog [Myotis lucifugus]|uniref:uncharacterized protein C1orf226 homolog n=1 Tax=Myotis lucifugus TaxID=59463 RepID=UPI000CCC5A43|nr:uncharacterized protein C1orf226 homolog [Myotis lucifugus]
MSLGGSLKGWVSLFPLQPSPLTWAGRPDFPVPCPFQDPDGEVQGLAGCLGCPYLLTQPWVWCGAGQPTAGGTPPLTRRLCLFLVGPQHVENLNTSLPTESRRPATLGPRHPGRGPLGPVEPGGPGLWVGSSQHLRNLGKAMGAKVNDFLRRREPWGLGSVGAMEVNRTAEAQLAGAPGGEDDGPALPEAVPLLDPPPPTTRKRTPRALKTTQDMLISAQPVLSSLECSPPPAQPGPAGAPPPEATVDVALPNGEASLSVPDLIHPDGSGEPRLKGAQCRRVSPPDPTESSGLQPSLSPGHPAELPQDSSPCPGARTCSLDSEGPHPDLLSFE